MIIIGLNNDDNNSFGDILKELDEANIKISVQLSVIKRGKKVTTIKGFTNQEQIETTAHELKKTIGTGGTSKNGLIVLKETIDLKYWNFFYPRAIKRTL